MAHKFVILDKVIGCLSIMTGLFLLYESSVFFYNYNFTHKLYYYMIPMNTLVTAFLFGLTSTAAGLLLLERHALCIKLYYMLVVALIFFAINPLEDRREALYIEFVALCGVLSFFIIAYFKLRPSFDSTKVFDRRKTLIMGLIGGCVIVFLPAVIF